MFVLVCAYVHVKALHVMQNNTKKQGAVIAVYKIWRTTAVTVRELLGCYLTIKSESNIVAVTCVIAVLYDFFFLNSSF